MNIAVVTDSTCDLPEEIIQASNIFVMRNFIIMNGKSLEDGIEITREEFYQRLPEMRELPTTATASAGAYEELYDKLFTNGAEHIISIHPSVQLSGILNATTSAAQAFPGRVHIIDSQTITMGLGFQVIEAAKAVADGLKIEEVLKYLKGIQQRVRVIAMLDSLEYIRKSGRVSWARASFGALLNIKAFVEIKEGRVLRMDQVRTRRKGIDRVMSLIREAGQLNRLAILHTNAEEDARLILDRLEVVIPTSPLIVNVTTIIGTHVGPNCLGFAIVTE